MNSSQAISAYRSVGVQSGVTDASPHQLISMLLDGALDRISQAKGAMERGDIARQGEMLGKAMSIVDSLRVTLDAERGGELATRLYDLYDYMQQRLLDAARAADVAMLDEVRGLLGEIKSGWDGIPAEYR